MPCGGSGAAPFWTTRLRSRYTLCKPAWTIRWQAQKRGPGVTVYEASSLAHLSSAVFPPLVPCLTAGCPTREASGQPSFLLEQQPLLRPSSGAVQTGTPADEAAGLSQAGRQQVLGRVASAGSRPGAAAAASRVAGEVGEPQQGGPLAAQADCSRQDATTGSKRQSAVADWPNDVAHSRQRSAPPPRPAEGKQPAAAAQQAAREDSKPTGATLGHGQSLKRKVPARPSNNPQAAAAEQTRAVASGQQGGADVTARQQRLVRSKPGLPESSPEPVQNGSEEPRPSQSAQKKPRLGGPPHQYLLANCEQRCQGHMQ